MSKARAFQCLFLAVCMLVSVAGARASGDSEPFKPEIQYVAIILAAIWFGPWKGILVAVFCSVLTGPLMPFDAGVFESHNIGAWFPRFIYYAAVAAAFGILQRRADAHLEALEKAKGDLEKRNADLVEAKRSAEEETRKPPDAPSSEAQALLEISGLSHLDAVVFSGRGEEAILETIADTVCTVTGAQLGLVVYVDPTSNSLVLKAQSGLHGESATKMKGAIRRMRAGHGLPWQAMLGRQPLSSMDVWTDADEAEGEGPAGVAAPLISNDEPFGAVWAVWRVKRPFRAEEIERVGRIARQASLAIQKARTSHIIEDVTFDTILALAEAIEGRTSYTSGRVARIVEYADLMARALGLPEEGVRAIRYGAALRDVGMMGVPDEVINKPSHLTEDELRQVRQHPFLGSQLCRLVSFLEPLVPIVNHHHERFDGRGYPDGLRGKAIPLGARIVAVADAYDAITTSRPYRAARSVEDAAKAMRAAGGHQLDPELVDVLLKALEDRQGHAAAA